MKITMIMYAVIAIIIQIILGLLTGNGQGSVGLLIFLVLIEIDPRFSFTYMASNIQDMIKNKQVKGELKWLNLK